MIMNNEVIIDKIFKGSLRAVGLVLLGIPLLLLGVMFFYSLPSIKAFGFRFIVGQTWDPVKGMYGGLPFLVGTLLTSLIALVISFPFSFSTALLLSEYLEGGILANMLKSAIELLAGIPSVIYGFWGLIVLVPLLRKLEMTMGIPPYGVSIFGASIILSIMIIPYASTMSREVMRLVPGDIKEAAYSLGGTHWEVIKRVVIPTSRSGIFAGILLALGRALGETMAVTMIIGNKNQLTFNVFEPGNTMASVIANEFTEASDTLYLSSLIELGLLLFVVTAIINFLGRKIIERYEIKGDDGALLNE